MTTEEIQIKGMHCNSCEKTITRTFAKKGIIVHTIAYGSGIAMITHNNISKEKIKRILETKGYTLDDGAHSGNNDNSKNNVKRAQEGSNHCSMPKTTKKLAQSTKNLEKDILTNGFLALSILLLVQTLLALDIYSKFPGYSQKYFLPLLYLPIAIVTNIIAIWHQRAYRGDVSCMTGMMIGMTIGMTTGFMVGGIVGLTNGMFTGSIVGVAIGSIAGIYAGNCCGIMGMMEGMMAGLMGGLMGAMTTVMMVIDHVEIFLPILLVLCIIILAGLMRVVMQEHEDKNDGLEPWPFTAVLAVSFIVMFILSMIVVIAPKGLY